MHQFEALERRQFCLSIRERHIFSYLVTFDTKTKDFSGIQTNFGFPIYQGKRVGAITSFVGDSSRIMGFENEYASPILACFDVFGSLCFPWSAPIVCILLSQTCSVYSC
jgi:hypothetical protein